MSLPLQTPTPKAASLIKRFQTTIDSLDGQQNSPSSHPSLKKPPIQSSEKRRSISSANPRVTPLNQIKRNLPLGTPSKLSPSRSPVANPSLQANQKLQPQIDDTTSKLTTNLDPSMDDPSDTSNPLIDQPSDLKQFSTDQPPQESSNSQPSDLPKQSPTNKLSDLPKQSPTNQPRIVSKPSDLRESGATSRPIHSSKAAKPQPTRASLTTLTQSKVKPTAPTVTRGSLSSYKHPSLSASTADPRFNAPSHARQSLSQKHASLGASVAPRVKTRDSQVAPSTNLPTVSETRTAPGKVLQKSMGTTASPKNTSTLRTTTKINAIPNLAKADKSATESSIIRKAHTSLRPVKEIVNTNPAKPVPQATTQVIRKTGIVQTKSAPPASVATKVSVAKKPTNAAPAKVTTQSSISDLSKPTQAEPKARSVANNTSTPSKKLDTKPVARARVSVGPSVVAGVKKPTNFKLAAQSSDKLATIANSNLQSITANKTPDRKSLSSRNSSTLVKVSSATKAPKLSTVPVSTVPVSDAPSTQQKDNPITKNEEILSPVSLKEESVLEAANEDNTQAQPVGELESQSHLQLEDQHRAATPEDKEYKDIQFVDRNGLEKKTLSVESDVNDEPHSIQSENHDLPVSVEKELPAKDANQDDFQVKSVRESEPLNYPALENQDFVPRSAAQEDMANSAVNQNQPEKEIIPVNSEADNLVGELELEPQSQLEVQDYLVSVKTESTVEKLSEVTNQTQRFIQSEPTVHSQLEDQDQAASAIEQEYSDQAANIIEQEDKPNELVDKNQLEKQLIPVDSEADRLLGEPELDTPSPLVHASLPKELPPHDVNEDEDKKPVNQSEIPTDCQLKDECNDALSEAIDIASRFDNQDQVKREIISQNSEAADLVIESTLEPHFQPADKNQIPTSGKQVDHGLSVNENYVQTEMNPNVPKEADLIETGASSAHSEVPSFDASQAADHERLAGSEEQDNEAHLLDKKDCNEHKVFSSSQTLDSNLRHNELPADHCAHGDDASNGEENQAAPLLIKQTNEEGRNDITMEAGEILPQPVVARQIANETTIEPPVQFDEYNQAPTSEESKKGTHQFNVEDQTNNGIIPTNDEGSESADKSQSLQFEDENQVSEPEETDSQFASEDPATRSETSESESSQFVYFNNQAAQESTPVNLELERTSNAAVTPESEASHFVYYHHQAKQEKKPLNSGLNPTPTMEAVSSITETKLSILPYFDASLTPADDKVISKNEEGYHLASSAKEFEFKDITHDDTTIESESIVFQLEEEGPTSGFKDRVIEANQFNNRNLVQGETISLNYEADDLVREFKTESHSQVEEKDSNSRSEEEFDVDHQIVNENDTKVKIGMTEPEVTESVAVSQLETQPEEQVQAARSEGKDNLAHEFDSEDLEETELISGQSQEAKSFDVAQLLANPELVDRDQFASSQQQKNEAQRFIIEDEEEQEIQVDAAVCDTNLNEHDLSNEEARNPITSFGEQKNKTQPFVIEDQDEQEIQPNSGMCGIKHQEKHISNGEAIKEEELILDRLNVVDQSEYKKENVLSDPEAAGQIASELDSRLV